MRVRTHEGVVLPTRKELRLRWMVLFTPALLLSLSCALAVPSSENQIATQVEETIQTGERSTQAVQTLAKQIAATLAGENASTESPNGEDPTPSAPPTETAVETPSPTLTSTSSPIPPSATSPLLPILTEQPTVTPRPTNTPSPRIYNREVLETNGITHTQIDVSAGETVTFQASGSMWSGVILTGENGPDGWDNTDCDSKFPLPCAHPYAFLAKIDPNVSYMEIGASGSIVFAGPGTREIILAINDDAPGNGSGGFRVNIVVYP